MSSYRIKDWHSFQHFKDRQPIWIKLYRKLLDDPEWFRLSGDAAKGLVGLWLLASETDGYLPDISVISFRLRISEKAVSALLATLSHYVIEDDINTISTRYQVDAPETETETEKRREDKETERACEDNSKPIRSVQSNQQNSKIRRAGDVLTSILPREVNAENLIDRLVSLTSDEAYRSNGWVRNIKAILTTHRGVVAFEDLLDRLEKDTDPRKAEGRGNTHIKDAGRFASRELIRLRDKVGA
jgi:hypothetical protein